MSVNLAGPLVALFTPEAVVAELREAGDISQLLPEEQDGVREAVPSRAREFAAGRICARQAMLRFGIADFALRVAADRQPIWPGSVVGSITHTKGFCAAVVASRESVQAIGLDSEITGAAASNLWSTLCGNDEMAWLMTLPLQQRAAAATLVFSAKEAFYKCQFALTAEWLDFHDVEIVPTWGSAQGTFTITAKRQLRIERVFLPLMRGCYVFHEQFVSTGVTVPSSGAAPHIMRF